jgi:flagellar biosynthesis protein FlhG
MTIGRTLAVASGKGGVGKTWFAITLARALTQQGCRVLLFDGDLGLANIDIQLGLTPSIDLSAVVARRASMQEAVTAYEPGGFDVLAGRSGSGTLAALDPAALERVLQELQVIPGYDHVVLDLGAGLDRATRRMAAWSDTLLVMATEEPTSLTDAYAVVKLHAADRPGGDSRFVVNQIASAAAGARTFATLARACTVFLGRTPPLAGAIRRDDHVRDAIRRQTLLQTRHPSSPAVVDVERIAAALLG